jgi:predicted 3-demethylubiquinone-9 3-methyltransferase (glyoxalase superfamily)
MSKLHRITPCLWFDGQAEAAAQLYTSVFPNSRITNASRYFDSGKEVHGHDAGNVLTVSFELDGLAFTALNGGPQFRFTEAISLMIGCDTQEEIDHYWYGLSDGGPVEAQQCGWLKDRFGLSWQVTPNALMRMIGDRDRVKAERAFAAMMQMKKLDIAALERAFAG